VYKKKIAKDNSSVYQETSKKPTQRSIHIGLPESVCLKPLLAVFTKGVAIGLLICPILLYQNTLVTMHLGFCLLYLNSLPTSTFMDPVKVCQTVVP
jgi:hypothetical protein